MLGVTSHGYETNETAVYRYLDKLDKTQKRTVQQISYAHTLKILNNDVTTLYFEIQQEDALRETGFSKEGKHQNPQIVLGLLVKHGGAIHWPMRFIRAKSLRAIPCCPY